MLRDLNDLALRVRDDKSRENILEAITCYEAGAYRAAIVTTWTAVAYDLIDKIVELAAEGDAEASAFSSKFQNAQANQNVEQLLTIERGIVDYAQEKFQFIDIAEREALLRLRDDRHKCAHPAFVADDRLFQPPDELARYYISLSLDSVLTKPPVFGKVILDKFSRAFSSKLFPSEKLDSLSYVKNNFLDKIRDNFLRNFTLVVAKALVKELPSEWAGGARKNLSITLEAISTYEKSEWDQRLRHEVIRLEESASEEGRRTFVGLLGLIPSLRIGMAQEQKDRLKVSIENFDPATGKYLDMFLGIRVPSLRTDILARFKNLSDDDKVRVIRSYPEPSYWNDGLEIFGKATSFRHAEAQYDAFIKPFNRKITRTQLIELTEKIIANGQIWDAAGIPAAVAATIEASENLSGLKAEDLVTFRDKLQEYSRLSSYAVVFTALKEIGIDLYADQDCKYEDALPF